MEREKSLEIKWSGSVPMSINKKFDPPLPWRCSVDLFLAFLRSSVQVGSDYSHKIEGTGFGYIQLSPQQNGASRMAPHFC